MSAQILDGKACAKEIKDELTTAVAKLAENGVVPGLGTVLVGEDPGSKWYVAGKHRDCAEARNDSGFCQGRHRLGEFSLDLLRAGSAVEDLCTHQYCSSPS